MFGRKKKKENHVLSHHVLGDITTDSFMHTVCAYDVTLYEKKHTVFLYINSPDFMEKQEFRPNQEKTIDYFVANLSSIEKSIEDQLASFFKINDYSIFKEKLNLENMSISNNGELAAFFNSEFSDEDLKNIDNSVNFTDSFGIVVFPEERFLYNEDECYKFDT